jgi:hypothetical protein
MKTRLKETIRKRIKGTKERGEDDERILKEMEVEVEGFSTSMETLPNRPSRSPSLS